MLFTDADLSTHLAQAGLLLDPIIRENQTVAIGSRRHPASVVLKEGTRNNRGKLFIYLWKRIIPQLREITDTQCGFKAFRSDTMRTWIDSDAASTTTDLQPYLPMLQSVSRFYRKILPPDPTAETFASLIESLSQADFARLAGL